MIDELDRKILNLLQQNAKLTIKELAESLALTTTRVFERIKRLEREGVIQRYVALINPEKVAKAQMVLLHMHMPIYTAENVASFEDQVRQMPEVLECYHVAGTIDYQLKVVVQDVKAYDRFLMKMAQIQLVNVVSSMIVLHEVKQTTFIAL